MDIPCGCGRSYDDARWSALSLARHGFQDVPFDPDDCDCGVTSLDDAARHAGGCRSRGYTLELRNCPVPCFSTLARTRPLGWRPTTPPRSP